MVGFLIGVILVLAATPAVASHVAMGDVRTYCASLGVSYSTQLYCVQTETAALQRLDRRLHSFEGIDTTIWKYCAGLGVSWTTLEYCIRQEEDAKRKLER
jgi:hypothetical protein